MKNSVVKNSVVKNLVGETISRWKFSIVKSAVGEKYGGEMRHTDMLDNGIYIPEVENLVNPVILYNINMAWRISLPYFSPTVDFTTENFHLIKFFTTEFFTTEFFTTEFFTTENFHYRIFSPTNISPPNFQFHQQYFFIKLP